MVKSTMTQTEGIDLPASQQVDLSGQAAHPYARQTLGLLDYRWLRPPPRTEAVPLTLDFDFDLFQFSDDSPEPTLDDSVIEGLISALYEALPEALNEPLPETTISGNQVGRHGFSRRPAPLTHWGTPPSRPATLAGKTTSGEGGRIGARRLPPPPELEPRPYVLGPVPDGLVMNTLRSLTKLSVVTPSDRTPLTGRAILGSGEPCFLRAQSALWSWRTHRQINLELHSHGPPLPGRNALIEQKVGPVTLLLGCRVTDMTELPRQWGFTLVSLSGQVLLYREEFMVDWHPDDTVEFTVKSQQDLAMSNLAFLGPVLSAMRRKFKQGYVRNMLELTAD